MRERRAGSLGQSGSQLDGFSKHATSEFRTQRVVGNEVDLRSDQFADLALEPSDGHESDRLACREQQIDVRAVIVRTGCDRPENSNVVPASLPNDLSDGGAVALEGSCALTGPVEVQ